MDRRDVLKNIGTVAGGAALLPGVTSANSAKTEIEKMPRKERRSFVGTVMSSAYFKSVKDELKGEGFKINPGKGISKQVRNTELDESVKRLTIPGKNKKSEKEALIHALETPDGELTVIGFITETKSGNSSLVAQFVSNASAQENTEHGCYVAYETGGEN
jgi:hypothetical protein